MRKAASKTSNCGGEGVGFPRRGASRLGGDRARAERAARPPRSEDGAASYVREIESIEDVSP